jgi:hypothetical protein
MSPGTPALRLYLDEDVDILLADLLTARGFVCLTTLQAGHSGWSDEAHLEYSFQETRILISHNRTDFEQLAFRWWSLQKEHAGIVLAVRRANTYDLARHVLPVLVRFDQPGWRNCVLYA